MALLRSILIVILLALAAAPTAKARDAVVSQIGVLDRPLSVQRLPSKSTANAVGELRCSYFKDLLIRETGVDTPAPADASLIPIAAGTANPPCSAAKGESDLALKTASHTLAGRKGPFLFFRQTDPHGPIPFLIINSIDGRIIYNDSDYGDGFRSISLTRSGLHLHYVRGISGTCSLYKEGPACWAKMMNEGKIPRVMTLAQPSVQLCGAAYRRSNTPADTPSIVYYDVNVTLEQTGKIHVNSRGQTNCAPMP
jgi:hypothetical protein